MVDGHLFEKISEIAARLRKKTDRPFGGIQVGPVLLIVSVDDDGGGGGVMVMVILYSLSSLATSFNYPPSPKQAYSLSSHSSVMHGKGALSIL